MILLFAYEGYYPSGGAHDLIGVYDTLDEAARALGAVTLKFAHAYSTDERAIVADWYRGNPNAPPPWAEGDVPDERIEAGSDKRRWLIGTKERE